MSGYAGTPRFPAVEAHTEHRVLVQPDGGSIVPSPPDPKPVIWLVSMGLRLRPRTLRLRFYVQTPPPPPDDSDEVMLSRDRSPRSESKCPEERPSSCDAGHNARLAMKGSVQQSPVDRPVYSEHAPVTGTRYRDPVPGTRCSVPPTTPCKPGTVTTPGIPITEFHGHIGRIGQTSPHWSESSIGKGRPVPDPV